MQIHIFQNYTNIIIDTFFSAFLFTDMWKNVLLFTSILILFIVFIKIRDRVIHKAKIRLEKMVMERTAEIEQQKEEILVQTEQLSMVNKELTKLSVAASKTDNAILILDCNGKIEWVNESFTRMFCFTYTDLLSEGIINFVDLSASENIHDIIETCVNEKITVVYEAMNITHSGERIWAQTSMTPIVEDNYVTKLVVVDTNVSKIKEAEEQINQQMAEIEEHRDELQELMATKDKIFSVIAHDLKDPIASFSTSLDLVLQNFNTCNITELEEFLKELQKSADSTYTLLINLLDWLRSQRNETKIIPEKFDIFPIIEELYVLLKSNLENKKILFKNSIPKNTLIFVDKQMITVIFRNLISNSIKFTDENGLIEIKTKNFGDYLEVQFFDSGIGMSSEQIDNLFVINSSNRREGTRGEQGTGLGLLLCKEFVEKNHGRIWATSELGKGSIFYVVLPTS